MSQTSAAFRREVAAALKAPNVLPGAVPRQFSGTSLSITQEMDGGIQESSNTGAIAIELPAGTQAGLPPGFTTSFIQGAAGQITFSVPSGSTLKQVDSAFKSRKVDAFVTAHLVAVNGANSVWRLYGDLVA